MEITNYSAFVCVIAPFLLLALLAERRDRAIAASVCVGLIVCMMASELNSLLLGAFGEDRYVFIITSITPLVEEVLKGLPIIFLFYMWDDRLESLMLSAFAIGVGFAVMENLILMVNNAESITLAWAFVRGACTGLMHAISTSMVSIAVYYLGKNKVTAFLGVLAALSLAITFHSTYNALVESSYMLLGFVLPITVYVCIAIITFYRRRTHKTQGDPSAADTAEFPAVGTTACDTAE